MSPRLWSERQQRKELETLEQGGGGGGGGSLGSPIVRKFPFAFDTPNLLTGHAVYTPAIGDILFDAWIECVTPFDNGLVDVGAFADDGDGRGWWREFGLAAVSLSFADRDSVFPEPNLITAGQGTSTGATRSTLRQAADFVGLQNSFAVAPAVPVRLLPAKFVRADPVKVVVSSNGAITGTDPGATQGEAVLYLVTATPV